MSEVAQNQPTGTPTWIDLGVPDLKAAQEFYGAVFGWGFQDFDGYSFALHKGKRVAGLSGFGEGPEFWWSVYLATDDVAATCERVRQAGGQVLHGPGEMAGLGEMAGVVDSVGAPFGLWHGKGLVGCELVNEPNTLVRNDLTTGEPAKARDFYTAVFDFSVEVNNDVPGMDHTFLRRPDGYEVAGILGNDDALKSRWSTAFEVADADETAKAVIKAGGQVQATYQMVYGDFAVLRDPFDTEFSVVSRPKGDDAKNEGDTDADASTG